MSSFFLWPQMAENRHDKRGAGTLALALAMEASNGMAARLEGAGEIDMALELEADGDLGIRRLGAGTVDVALALEASHTIRALSAPDIWWSMDEAGPSLRADSANAYDIASSGASITGVAGKVDNAAQLQTSEYLVREDAIPDHSTDWSWCCWVQTSNTSARILTLRDSTYSFLNLRLTGTHLSFHKISAIGGIEELLYALVPTTTPTWWFITVSYDAATQTIKIYVNGSLVLTEAFVDAIAGSSWDHVEIGGDPYAAFLADEYARFPDVLTQVEIDWLYNSGNGRAFSELP